MIRHLVIGGAVVLQAGTAGATETLLTATPVPPQELVSPFQLDDVWVETAVAEGYLNPNIDLDQLEAQGGSLQLNLMPEYEDPVFDTLFIRPSVALDAEYGRWEAQYWQPESIAPTHASFVWNRATGRLAADVRGPGVHYRIDSYPNDPTHLLIRRLDDLGLDETETCGGTALPPAQTPVEPVNVPDVQDFSEFCIGPDCQELVSDLVPPSERCLPPPPNQDSCDPLDPGVCLLSFFFFYTEEALRSSPIVFRIASAGSFIPTILAYRDFPTQVFLQLSRQDILFNQHNNSDPLSTHQFYYYVSGWREMPKSDLDESVDRGISDYRRRLSISLWRNFLNDRAPDPQPQRDCRADFGLLFVRSPAISTSGNQTSITRGAASTDLAFGGYVPQTDNLQASYDPSQPQDLNRLGQTAWSVLESPDFTPVHEIGHLLKMDHQRFSALNPQQNFYSDVGFAALVQGGIQNLPVGFTVVRQSVFIGSNPVGQPVFLTYSSATPLQGPGAPQMSRGSPADNNEAVVFPQTMKATASAEFWDIVVKVP
ncbi:MAG: hypothetical protein AAGJ19_22320 [Myxococcota bacterium]